MVLPLLILLAFAGGALLLNVPQVHAYPTCSLGSGETDCLYTAVSDSGDAGYTRVQVIIACNSGTTPSYQGGGYWTCSDGNYFEWGSTLEGSNSLVIQEDCDIYTGTYGYIDCVQWMSSPYFDANVYFCVSSPSSHGGYSGYVYDYYNGAWSGFYVSGVNDANCALIYSAW
jgi:hypothetical protein